MRVTPGRLFAALAVFAAATGAASGAWATATPAPACPPAAIAPTPEVAATAQRDAVDRGPLWKATKDGRTVYLYGTIHVAQWHWIYPGPQVRRAIEASDVVALELDLADPGMMLRLQKAILRDASSPGLPEALHQRLLADMAAACIEPAALAPLRVEMQAVTLEVMLGRAAGLYPDYGIDTHLATWARAHRKSVRSLETPESQAELLVSDDPEETARTVGAMLDELESDKAPAMLRRLASDWVRGDVDDMAAYASWCGCLDTPDKRADFDKLVLERNPLMADRIVQWHGEGTSLFVAVGTLHMVGPIGLPTLLKARGFKVERVPTADAR
jgi:uncharacterized protein YbaP (TraB family)